MVEQGRILINVNDIVGKRFGNLVVTNYSGWNYSSTNSGFRVRHWYTVICDCGKIKVIRRSQLLTGGTKSCGCSKKKRGKVK